MSKKDKKKIEDDEDTFDEDEEIESKHISKHLKKGKVDKQEASADALRNQNVIPRHLKVVEEMSGNIRKKGKGKGNRAVSRKQAMINKGYSESYANSSHIKKTRSWDIILKEVFNDDFLSEQHLQLFNATETQRFIFPTRMKDDEIVEMVNEAGFKVITIRPSPLGKMVFYSIPNTRAKKDALDFAYKLKGKYSPEEFNLKFKGFSKEQLIEFIMGKIMKEKKK